MADPIQLPFYGGVARVAADMDVCPFVFGLELCGHLFEEKREGTAASGVCMEVIDLTQLVRLILKHSEFLVLIVKPNTINAKAEVIGTALEDASFLM